MIKHLDEMIESSKTETTPTFRIDYSNSINDTPG